jgi:hypothetical protein
MRKLLTILLLLTMVQLAAQNSPDRSRQTILPANGTVFSEVEINKPILFRWSVVVASAGEAITYRLRIWRIANGQTAPEAIRSGKPLFTKDVVNTTETMIERIVSSPCSANDPCNFVWNVQALNRDGKPVGPNDGTGSPAQFSAGNCNVSLVLRSRSVECVSREKDMIRYKVCLSATYISPVYELTYSNSGSGFKAYHPSNAPSYNISGLSPVMQTQTIGAGTTVSYCFDVIVPSGQTVIKIGLQGDDKDPGPIVCQPGAELDIKLPDCKKTCNCGTWDDLIVTGTEDKTKYTCGRKIPWNCNRPFRFVTGYHCDPDNKECQARIGWKITKGSTLVKSGTGTGSITDGFTPLENGEYTLTLQADCNGMECKPCTYTIVVENCATTGECVCGTWGQLTVQNAAGLMKYNCGGDKIAWKCNQLFRFNGTYQCDDKNEKCEAQTSWEIKKDGMVIRSGTGGSQYADAFTPTANGVYTISLQASCNGKKCPPCTYTIVVENCTTTVECGCGTWGQLIIQNAAGLMKYDCGGDKIPWKCNQLFRFNGTYQCENKNEKCEAQTSWEIKKDGIVIKSGTGGSQYADAFTPTANGVYTLSLQATCNGKKCPPCTYIIVVEDCQPAVECGCGTWGQLIVQNAAGLMKYDCGSDKIAWKCNQLFRFNGTYQCENKNEKCEAQTSWEIKKDGIVIRSGAGGSQYADAFTPPANGVYTISLQATCNGKKCPPCVYTVVVDDCATTACDCSKDMYVIAHPGNLKIRCNETKVFPFGTTIALSPQNICVPAECLSGWSVKVYDTQTGALVTTGSGTGSNGSFSFLLNSLAGYRVVLTADCNGKTCTCEFWIRTSNPTAGCDCGGWKDRSIRYTSSAGDCGILECGKNIHLTAGVPYTFTAPVYNCSQSTDSCQANYAWQVNGSMQNTGSTFTYTFTGPDDELTVRAHCKDKVCDYCSFHVLTTTYNACDSAVNNIMHDSTSFKNTLSSSQLIDFDTYNDTQTMMEFNPVGDFPLPCWTRKGITFAGARSYWNAFIYGGTVAMIFPPGLYTKAGFVTFNFYGLNSSFTVKVYSVNCIYTYFWYANPSLPQYFGINLVTAIDKIEITNSNGALAIENFRFGN